MPRCARVVVPGQPHHITHRGNNGDPVFLSTEDRISYLYMLGELVAEHRLRLLGHCLMDNHVHLIGIPESQDSMAATVRALHARHATRVNRRTGRVGHLWRSRYYSCLLDPDHLVNAMRYVERNPVRARMVPEACMHRWSSAALHCGVQPGVPCPVDPEWAERWAKMFPPKSWRRMLRAPEDPIVLAEIRERTRSGRPYTLDE